jgi:hypothetical protein
MRQESTTIVGTSFYLGIPRSTLLTTYDCVSMAADLGITHFFTSLQMPEADIPSSIDEFRKIGRLAQQMRLSIMADVHPIVFRRIGGSIEDFGPFRELGLSSIRLDAGFSDEDIAQVLTTAEHFGMHVVLNASPATNTSLGRLSKLGVNLENAVACHNYYPRVETGLSRSFIRTQADILHAHGCVIMGFVASQKNHRYMTYEGLPTLECHRYVEPAMAAQELLGLGWCDHVYIGDQTENQDELKSLLDAVNDPCLVLRIRMNPLAQDPEKFVVLGSTHQHLPQEFELVYRARGSRQKHGQPIVLPLESAVERPRGTVTVDNALYPRFAGELQITRVDLGPDIRTNVVGWVIDEDLPKLDDLGPLVKFRFESVPN